MNAGELHRLARLLREVAQLATANAGERPPAASTVAIVEDVAEHPGAPIKDIVARTGLAQSLVSRTVDQLQGRGVLTVMRDPVDGRRSLVEIDPKIRKGDFTSRGGRPVSAALHRRLPSLDVEQRARVEAALDLLAEELLGRADG
jgi:DNA-binding MarR family transcriptional regulator